MLDGIKSKLGFADANDQYTLRPGTLRRGLRRIRRIRDDYGEGYDEFADYGPDYDENAQGGSYEPYAPVTTRAPAGRRVRPQVGAHRTSMPKLVSIDDVRAHTQLPESLPATRCRRAA